MPSKYQRQTNRRQWGEDTLKAVLQAIEDGSRCCNAASVAYKRQRIKLPEHADGFKSAFNPH